MAYRCKGGFAIQTGSGPVVYAAGRLVGDDDPILRTHGVFFEPVEMQVQRQEQTPRSVTAVETATAAPGEARQVSVPRNRLGRKGSEQ